MTDSLEIPAEGALDFLALGGLVQRLDSGIVPYRKATECQLHVSGAEYNVAANLSDCFGLRTGIVTAMVDYPVGHLIGERVRAMGVQPFYKRFAHDGVTGPNMATVYCDRGYGVRSPVVFYDRANEAASLLKPGDIDWGAIFATGVRWFHSGGVFAALSPTTSELIIEGMSAARTAGAVVSFDLNYREPLWMVRGGQAEAVATMRRILENVDVLVGSKENMQQALGIPATQIGADSKLDPAAAVQMIESVVGDFPQIRVVAATLREVLSSSRHRWAAVTRIDGETCVTPTVDLDVFDRVGGGDGFAAGFFYGLLAGKEAEHALRLGWAHGALLATFPGDTTMATLNQVCDLAEGSSARVQWGPARGGA